MFLYVKLRCKVFLTDREQRLYEYRFVWVQKYVMKEKGKTNAHWNTDYLLENLSHKDHTDDVD